MKLFSFCPLSQKAGCGKFLVASAFAAVCTLAATHVPAVAQNLPSLGDVDREQLSPLLERRLGEQIMWQIRRDRDFLDDPPVLEYLDHFGASLLASHPEARGESQYEFFFFAVRDPMLNAFALPGGFIGVHSALILAAQNESELASVLAHEIGHVSQRHIARMLGKQRQDTLIPLAAAVLAALAARSSPDASAALLMGGQGMALQRQLNFSREAEREADRIGLQILSNAGYDTSGIISFLGRVQSATRAYNDSAPAYLRSHPLTTERIADIQARTRDQHLSPRQRQDSLDFHLVRARVRVLQDLSGQGLRNAAAVFESQLQQKASKKQVAAAKYGLALVALRESKHQRALVLLEEAKTEANASAARVQTAVLPGLAIDIHMAAGQPEAALREAEAARKAFPTSRAIAWQYADTLMAAGRNEEAVRYLRDQAQTYRQEPQLHDRLAKAYAALGKQALQHLALAESYALSGGLLAALDQLAIARRAPDATFYDHAQIDARERELQARRREELQDERTR